MFDQQLDNPTDADLFVVVEAAPVFSRSRFRPRAGFR
jgi:hypothetical protein